MSGRGTEYLNHWLGQDIQLCVLNMTSLTLICVLQFILTPATCKVTSHKHIYFCYWMLHARSLLLNIYISAVRCMLVHFSYFCHWILHARSLLINIYILLPLDACQFTSYKHIYFCHRIHASSLLINIYPSATGCQFTSSKHILLPQKQLEKHSFSYHESLTKSQDGIPTLQSIYVLMQDGGCSEVIMLTLTV